MNGKLKLTKTTVERLPLAEKPQDRKDYYDSELPNFGVRVSCASRKYFVMKYVGSKRVRVTLGDSRILTAEQAREKALTTLGDMAGGTDPNKGKRDVIAKQQADRDRLTVTELVTKYIENHAMREKKSWKEDKRCLEKEVIPLWGKRAAATIRKGDVIDLLDGIVRRGSPVMANNTFEKIRKMFNYAVEKDILEYSPCFGVKKPTKKEHKDRVLTDAEIVTVWHGLDNAGMSDEIRRSLRLILITAARPGEVIGMHSDEIAGEWWTIPADRSKNGKAHRVFLTEAAREIIGNKAGFIFESPVSGKVQEDGTPRPPQPMESNAVAFAVRKNLKFPLTDDKGNPLFLKDGKQATVNKIGVDDWTPHDLRRTAATNLAALGYTDEVIDAVLNHSKKGVVAIYNRHRYDKEKKGALEAWGAKLNQIITGAGKSNVVSIDTARKGKAA